MSVEKVIELWEARALAAEASRDEKQRLIGVFMQQRDDAEAERDEARAEVERLRRVLRSIEQDTVSTNLWLRQKTHDALELARVALSPSPPDTEEH